MATAIVRKALNSIKPSLLLRNTSSQNRYLGAVATAPQPEPDVASSSFEFSSSPENKPEDDSIYIKSKKPQGSSVTMPMSFMTGSIVGKRFYKQVTTREAEDGNGWTVMLDYRTLKTPTKRPLKCPTLALAKAIAAEWDYQLTEGIRPFTMPLMRLACTALERVPITRPKIIENLMMKVHQDLVFYRAPGDDDITSVVLEQQVKKLDPFLKWVESEFGYKPVVYSSFFGGKQEDGFVDAIHGILKRADDCELAAIDAIAASAHSLTIALGVVRGRLQIEDAVQLIRLEENTQIDRWGLVEGGHDVDVADLRVQISSAAVFLGLSRRH